MRIACVPPLRCPHSVHGHRLMTVLQTTTHVRPKSSTRAEVYRIQNTEYRIQNTFVVQDTNTRHEHTSVTQEQSTKSQTARGRVVRTRFFALRRLESACRSIRAFARANAKPKVSYRVRVPRVSPAVRLRARASPLVRLCAGGRPLWDGVAV